MAYSDAFIKLIEDVEKIPGAEQKEKFYSGLQELGQMERLKNLYRIEDKNTGEYVFFGEVINQEQIHYIENRCGRDLILKSRQIGMTGLHIILNIDKCLFTKGARAGIMAHTKDKAIVSIFERVRKTWEWFQKDWGDFLSCTAGSDSTSQLSFTETGSQIIVGYDFRTQKLTDLHVSETAFINDDERITASQQSVPPPPMGMISHETTPRGRAGWFFDNWMGSSECETKGVPVVWKQHFFKWFDHYPEKGQRFDVGKIDLDDREKELVAVYAVGMQSILWRRWKIQESYKGDPEKFEVDYPTDDKSCFIGGYGIVPRGLLIKLEKGLREPIFRGELVEANGLIKPVETKDGPIFLWEHPKAGVEYCGGLDSAEGMGRKHDYCAGLIKNRSTKRQVAMIHSNIITPDSLAKYAFLLGRYFNTAWWCPERNSCGGETVRQLDQLGYGAIYTPKADRVERSSDDSRLGFYTSGVTKEHAVLQFLTRLRSGGIIPSSKAWFDEMTNFGRDESGRLCALAGHDDLFMAGCLCEEMDRTLGDMEMVIDSEESHIEEDLSIGF